MMCHAYENMHGVVDVVLCPYIGRHLGRQSVGQLRNAGSCLISTLYISRCGEISLYHTVRL